MLLRLRHGLAKWTYSSYLLHSGHESTPQHAPEMWMVPLLSTTRQQKEDNEEARLAFGSPGPEPPAVSSDSNPNPNPLTLTLTRAASSTPPPPGVLGLGFGLGFGFGFGSGSAL